MLKVTWPVLLHPGRVVPEYPAEAKRLGFVGQVELRLGIDATGDVSRVVILEPAGHGFDEAAVSFASKLKFTPARTAEGDPIAVAITFWVRFANPPEHSR